MPALRPISSGSMQQPLPAALMSQMSMAAAPMQQTAESLAAANTQLREQIQQQLSTASVSARSSPSMVASLASRARALVAGTSSRQGGGLDANAPPSIVAATLAPLESPQPAAASVMEYLPPPGPLQNLADPLSDPGTAFEAAAHTLMAASLKGDDAEAEAAAIETIRQLTRTATSNLQRAGARREAAVNAVQDAEAEEAAAQAHKMEVERTHSHCAKLS